MDNKSIYRTVNDPDFNHECGRTNLKGPCKSIPANGMVRSNGYTHDGPCETWLDNTRVLHGDNCHSEIPGNRPFYKIDWSACKQDCVLRWYWFGSHHGNVGYSWK